MVFIEDLTRGDLRKTNEWYDTVLQDLHMESMEIEVELTYYDGDNECFDLVNQNISMESLTEQVKNMASKAKSNIVIYVKKLINFVYKYTIGFLKGSTNVREVMKKNFTKAKQYMENLNKMQDQVTNYNGDKTVSYVDYGVRVIHNMAILQTYIWVNDTITSNVSHFTPITRGIALILSTSFTIIILSEIAKDVSGSLATDITSKLHSSNYNMLQYIKSIAEKRMNSEGDDQVKHFMKEILSGKMGDTLAKLFPSKPTTDSSNQNDAEEEGTKSKEKTNILNKMASAVKSILTSKEPDTFESAVKDSKKSKKNGTTPSDIAKAQATKATSKGNDFGSSDDSVAEKPDGEEGSDISPKDAFEQMRNSLTTFIQFSKSNTWDFEKSANKANKAFKDLDKLVKSMDSKEFSEDVSKMLLSQVVLVGSIMSKMKTFSEKSIRRIDSDMSSLFTTITKVGSMTYKITAS